MKRKFSLSVFTALFACSLFANHAIAAPEMDEKSTAILDQYAEYYQGVESATVTISTDMTITVPGQEGYTELTSASLAVKRPNFLAIKSIDGPALDVIMDGDRFYFSGEKLAGYMDRPAPSNFDDLYEDRIMDQVMMQIGYLYNFHSDPKAFALEGMESVTHGGVEAVNGVFADRLDFDQEGIDATMWVQSEGDPKVLKMVLDLTAMFNLPPEGSAKLTMTYKDAKHNVELGDETWGFTAPEGKKAASTAFEAATGMQPPIAVGSVAQDFVLENEQGEKVKLSFHKGKEVVVLDFWATWCPPCVKGLPVIEGIAEEFADKGVAIYAVNLREDKGQIVQFLKEKNIALSWLMDKDGAVGEAYGVQSIPTTLVIGKDGLVKAVHTGLGPNLESELREEIEGAL